MSAVTHPAATRPRGFSSRIFCLGLFTIGIFAPLVQVHAQPAVEFGVGWGVTRMEWLEFDQTVSHVQFTADVRLASWLSLQAAYFNSGTGVERFLPEDALNFGPPILHLRSQALKIGPLLNWDPLPWLRLYTKPALSFNWARSKFSGGFPETDPGILSWRTRHTTRFAPAVGVKFRVFPRLLLGAEFEKSKIWRMDSDSYTFSVIVPWGTRSPLP